MATLSSCAARLVSRHVVAIRSRNHHQSRSKDLVVSESLLQLEFTDDVLWGAIPRSHTKFVRFFLGASRSRLSQAVENYPAFSQRALTQNILQRLTRLSDLLIHIEKRSAMPILVHLTLTRMTERVRWGAIPLPYEYHID